MASNKLSKAKLLERIRVASAEEVEAIRASYEKAHTDYATKDKSTCKGLCSTYDTLEDRGKTCPL